MSSILRTRSMMRNNWDGFGWVFLGAQACLDAWMSVVSVFLNRIVPFECDAFLLVCFRILTT